MDPPQNFYLVVEFLLTMFLAGLVGTAGMTLLMRMITKSGLTNADMVRAIGSILTGSLENALIVGTILHINSGIFFAMIYLLIFNWFGITGFLMLTLMGLGLGFLHGFVLSFILVVSVAEHHPMEEFRSAGIAVAVAHLVGHVVYGLLVGVMVGLSGFTLS